MTQTAHTVAVVLQYAIQIILLFWSAFIAWHGGESKAVKCFQKRLQGLGLESNIDHQSLRRIGKSVAILTFASLLVSVISDLSGAKLSAIHDTRVNDKIKQVSPSKQPIASMSAFARLEVRGKETRNSSNKDFPVSHLMLGRFAQIKTNHWTLQLVADKFEGYSNGEASRYYLQFHMNPISPMWNVGPGDTVEELDELNSNALDAFFLPENSEILGGLVTVTVNSLISKEYPIPPQKPFLPVITCMISRNQITTVGVGQGGQGSVVPAKTK